MIASLLIIACSLILLAYWFRYTCLLLLRTSRVDTPSLAGDDLRLNYRKVQDHLQASPDAALDPLQQALHRDYVLLTYLLEHAAGIKLNPVERHLLTADYRVMGAWYRIARLVSPAAARGAVEEMALVVSLLSDRMGSQPAN